MKQNLCDTAKGFTLMELLMVLSVSALIMGIAVPSLWMIGQSGRERQAVIDIAGLLETSRLTAVSQNTFIYVLFHQDVSKDGIPLVRALVLLSEDGTDVLAGRSGFDLSTERGLREVGREVLLQGCALVIEKSDVAAIAQNVTRPLATDHLATDRTVHVCRPGGPINYEHFIKFLPTGEARGRMESLTERIEFGLLHHPQTQNRATIFQISGLTGQSHVHRP